MAHARPLALQEGPPEAVLVAVEERLNPVQPLHHRPGEGRRDERSVVNTEAVLEPHFRPGSDSLATAILPHQYAAASASDEPSPWQRLRLIQEKFIIWLF